MIKICYTTHRIRSSNTKRNQGVVIQFDVQLDGVYAIEVFVMSFVIPGSGIEE